MIITMVVVGIMSLSTALSVAVGLWLAKKYGREE